MRKIMVAACVLATALFVAGPASALPTLEELAGKIAKAAAERKTCSCDMKVTMALLGVTAVGSGLQVEMVVTKDGKTVSKSCCMLAGSMKTPDGQEVKIEQKTVSDGTYHWQESNTAGAVTVTKEFADSKDEMGVPRGIEPAKEFEELWMAMYELRVTAEDTVNGEPVYVLEGKFRDAYLEKNPAAEPAKQMMNSVKMALSRNDFYPRRIAFRDADGNATIAMDLSNVKINVPVDEKLFTYAPPEGAQVDDKTKPQEEN